MNDAPPDALIFNSSASAFEYACAHLNNSLEGERLVVAIVLAVKGKKTIVKWATRPILRSPMHRQRSFLSARTRASTAMVQKRSTVSHHCSAATW